jgi:hypothetical protein
MGERRTGENSGKLWRHPSYSRAVANLLVISLRYLAVLLPRIHSPSNDQMGQRFARRYTSFVSVRNICI